MCHRISPLSFEEAAGALEALARNGRATVPPAPAAPADAKPGSAVPVYVANGCGGYRTVAMNWGFEIVADGKTKLVYNTRLDTALKHAERGSGMWARPILEGRCLVPERAFYESITRGRANAGAGANGGKRAPRGQVRFELAGRRVHLLAAVCQDGRFSLVTTEPNDAVAPFHDRMPLILDEGEAAIWMGPDFATLADRSCVRLTARKEQPASQAPTAQRRLPGME